MTKYKKYQDYVVKDGKHIGEYEELYQDFDDPWQQNKKEKFASEKAVCINLIKLFDRKKIIDIGCGLGHLTNRISQVAPYSLGIDIAPTAIKKAKEKYKNCNFEVGKLSDFKLIREFKPDCIVMAETTWYVLDELDEFIYFL